MAVYEFEGRVPPIASNAYTDEDTKVIGDVRIGARCFIGAGPRIRGVSEADKQLWTRYKEAHADLTLRYPKGLKSIK